MRSKSHIGKKKIRLTTFFIVTIVVILILLIHHSFINNKYVINKEIVPIQNSQSLIDNKNINVNVQRYYSGLPLLSDDDKKNETIFVINEINKNKISEEKSSLEKVNPSIETQVVSPVVNLPAEPVEEELPNLFDDSQWSDWDDVSELLPPTLFDPLIQSQQEYDMFNPVATSVTTYDDDFFSDFYVSGSDDDSLYPDGFYYLELFVNEELMGEIEVEFKEDDYYINSQELYNFIYNRLSNDAINRVFNDVGLSISINELNNRGVESSIDVDAFAVSLTFSLNDMPLIVIPVADIDKKTKILKNNKYSINDAEVIEPEFMSLVSSVNLYGNYSYGPIYSNLNPFTMNLYVNNSLALGEFEFNFSNNLSYTFGTSGNPLSFNFGSWSGTCLFYENNLRLTFGQVGGSLITKGTPIGFILEKSYTNGAQHALPHQFTKSFVIKDSASINIKLNGDIILSKRVKQGEYKFIDFAFKDGENLLEFDINYDDDQYKDINQQYSIAYNSGLLARGDYLYGLSGAIHKSPIDNTSKSLLALPYFDGEWYEYNLSAFEMKYWLSAGLSDEFTMKTSLAIAPDIMVVSFEGLLATFNGAYNGTLDIGLKDGVTPSLDLSLSHTFKTIVGPLSANFSMNIPEYILPSYTLSSQGFIGLSFGYNFNLWKLPPINSSLSITASKNEFVTSTSLGIIYTPVSGLSISSALSTAISNISLPKITFSVALNYSLISSLTASTSFSSEGDSSISASYKAGKNDSLQVSISNIRFKENASPTFSSTWAHTGNLSTLSLRQTISKDFKDYSTNASLSTTLYYANGLFGISGTTSSNFLLLKTTGKLKNGDLSISKTNNSSPVTLNSFFGTSVYTKLTPSTKNNIIVYGETDSVFSSGGTFSYELNTSSRSGFAKRLTIPASYTISGVLYDSDGNPYSQYSSPVYLRQVDENGNYYLQISENQYLFTDANGRYILNDVYPGIYVFDLQVDKKWYAISFEILEDEKYENNVIELEDYIVQKEDDDLLDWDATVDTESTDDSTDEFVIDTFGKKIVSEYYKFEFININNVIDEQTFSEIAKQEYAPSGFDEALGNEDAFEAPAEDPFADTASTWVDDDSWSF